MTAVQRVPSAVFRAFEPISIPSSVATSSRCFWMVFTASDTKFVPVELEFPEPSRSLNENDSPLTIRCVRSWSPSVSGSSALRPKSFATAKSALASPHM